MLIKLFKILRSKVSGFSGQCLVYCLLLAITVQSLAPGVVFCFENGESNSLNLCLEAKCCSTSEGRATIFRGSNFNLPQSNNSCETCVIVPFYKSVIQKNGSENIPENITILVLSIYYKASKVAKSSRNQTFQLTPSTNSCLSSLQTVVLLV